MDPVMRQSQGLSHPDAHRIYDRLFGEGVYSKFCLWRGFGEYELIEREGVYYVPISHDSVFARRRGLWTGIWVGTDLRLPCALTELDLFKAEEGIAIEGVDHTAAAISNVAFAGQAYKALMRRLMIPDFHRAAQAAGRTLKQAKMLDLQSMPRDPEGDEAVGWIMKQHGVQMEWALASLVHTIAYACKVKLEATARFLGIECPKSINIAGGWAQNSAFILALKSQGFEPNTPPHGPNATHAGLAAEALLRYWRLHGTTGATFDKALDAIPELK
jgi:hypothetical protein